MASNESQSHRTDQGDSEGHPCNPLNRCDLIGLPPLPLEKRLAAAVLMAFFNLLLSISTTHFTTERE